MEDDEDAIVEAEEGCELAASTVAAMRMTLHLVRSLYSREYCD